MPVRWLYRKSTILTVIVLAALAAGGVVPPAAAGSARTVVELFTSQGCSSCPPADAFIGELAGREDLLPLSFHVEYWNYLGWRDRFSSPEATARQRSYRRPLGMRYVYTPQIVVNGTAHAVGSGRAEVLRLIEAARGGPSVDIAVDHSGGDSATLRIAAGPRQTRPATIWLVFYDYRHVTEVRRGENAGASLVNTNVVRTFTRIGSWTGAPVKIPLSLKRLGAEGRDACAVIVQQDGNGPILGAVSFPLPRGRS